MKKYVCECLGTAVLVLFGCGIAVLSGADLVATALAFGLAIVAMAYVIGNVSGCHVNPAVSLAMLINKKLSVKEFLLYVVSQVIGAFVGAGILYFVLSNAGIGVENLGANGFGTLSVVIGLTLAFVHLLGIKLTGTSVNPARSLAPAVLQGGDALKQVWLFIVAPLCGSALSAVTFKWLNKEEK